MNNKAYNCKTMFASMRKTLIAKISNVFSMTTGLLDDMVFTGMKN